MLQHWANIVESMPIFRLSSDIGWQFATCVYIRLVFCRIKLQIIKPQSQNIYVTCSGLQTTNTLSRDSGCTHKQKLITGYAITEIMRKD